jgi:hypothetical protein
LALLWNGFGATDFAASTFAPDVWLGDMIGYTEPQIDYIKSFAWWQSAMWFVGTWGGFLGAIALLLRSRLAVWLFLVSLLGAVGSLVVTRTAESMPEGMDPGFLPNIIIAIAAVLVIYAVRMKRAGVLR